MARKALVIIAQQGFQDVELDGTRQGLKDAGFDVVLASEAAGECVGKFGGSEQATIALKDVRVEDYDRVAFIGGPGAHKLASNLDAQRIAVETEMAKKPLGAICIAPTILAEAGVLNGKKATVHNKDGEPEKLLKARGATYTGEDVTVDGLIVTGNGPEAAKAFGTAFAAA